MTIFQKMLITPVLSLTLYTGLLLYGFDEYRQSNKKVEQLSENYLSLMEVSGENARLFNEIVVQFKDAVLAGEHDWLSQTNILKERINKNFAVMTEYPDIIDNGDIDHIRYDFNQYYSNALTLSLALLKDDESFSKHEVLIHDVEKFSNQTTAKLRAFKLKLKDRFNQAINDSNARMNNLLFFGGGIAVMLLLLMVAGTTYLSISTKKNFQTVIDRMKALAEGRPDFSRRLVHEKRDELGYLIHWFNKLSDTLEQDYAKIEKISITDKLTQLSNRTHTDEYLQEQLKHLQVCNESGMEKSNDELVVIIADIDHFKAINDNYGHLIGDQVLREFSTLLKEKTRAQDFIGRWGGEEFIIVMPDIDLDQAVSNAERLRSAVEKFMFSKVDHVTASFGIATSIRGDTQESLISRADESLYQAKQMGRNQAVVTTA